MCVFHFVLRYNRTTIETLYLNQSEERYVCFFIPCEVQQNTDRDTLSKPKRRKVRVLFHFVLRYNRIPIETLYLNQSEERYVYFFISCGGTTEYQ